MLKNVKKVIDELNKNSIVYCHWKSNEHLLAGLDGDTDLDVLFDYSQKLEIERILAKCGLKHFTSTPLMKYNGIEDYIGFDKDEAKIWHLHTHYRLTLGESHLKGYTITPWAKHILDNRMLTKESVYISSHEDELLLLLCRIALKVRFRDIFRCVSNDDIKEISWLLDQINSTKFENISGELIGSAGYPILKELLDGKKWEKYKFLPLRNYLRKQLRFFTPYTKLGSFFTRMKRELFWIYGAVMRQIGINNYKPSRRFSPSGGSVVAFLGSDGAGKTTTLSYVKKEFSKKIDTVTIYFGSGDGDSSLIRKPMKFFAKKIGGKGVGHKVDEEYKTSKKISLKSRLYSIAKIFWAVSLANEKKRKFRKMTHARNNGLLVLTDRYPQIIKSGFSDGPLLNRYIEKSGILGCIARWEYKIYSISTINPPDLIIKLVVPTEIAIERKPEMTKLEIEEKRAVIENLNIANYSATIDTSRDFKVTVGEVMDEIWKII